MKLNLIHGPYCSLICYHFDDGDDDGGDGVDDGGNDDVDGGGVDGVDDDGGSDIGGNRQCVGWGRDHGHHLLLGKHRIAIITVLITMVVMMTMIPS